MLMWIILRPRTELATLCTELWENKRGTYGNIALRLVGTVDKEQSGGDDALSALAGAPSGGSTSEYPKKNFIKPRFFTVSNSLQINAPGHL